MKMQASLSVYLNATYDNGNSMTCDHQTDFTFRNQIKKRLAIISETDLIPKKWLLQNKNLLCFEKNQMLLLMDILGH